MLLSLSLSLCLSVDEEIGQKLVDKKRCGQFARLSNDVYSRRRFYKLLLSLSFAYTLDVYRIAYKNANISFLTYTS